MHRLKLTLSLYAITLNYCLFSAFTMNCKWAAYAQSSAAAKIIICSLVFKNSEVRESVTYVQGGQRSVYATVRQQIAGTHGPLALKFFRTELTSLPAVHQFKKNKSPFSIHLFNVITWFYAGETVFIVSLIYCTYNILLMTLFFKETYRINYRTVTPHHITWLDWRITMTNKILQLINDWCN